MLTEKSLESLHCCSKWEYANSGMVMSIESSPFLLYIYDPVSSRSWFLSAVSAGLSSDSVRVICVKGTIASDKRDLKYQASTSPVSKTLLTECMLFNLQLLIINFPYFTLRNSNFKFLLLSPFPVFYPFQLKSLTINFSFSIIHFLIIN
jgi:hypothetical protein